MSKAKKISGRSWPTVLDLFSGSGSVTEALKRRHFDVVAAVDSDPLACETYRLNHPKTRMIQNDIRKVRPREIRDNDLGGRDLDLMIVCAPCQPFSSQNRKKKLDDRSRLILQAGRFARALKPKVIFFENVPGLAAHSTLLDELKRKLGKDYNLGEPQRIDAADFGVPQRRVRCIMIATRKSAPPLPPDATTPGKKQPTVRSAIGHLKKLQSGEADPYDNLHYAREHQPITLKRLAAIPKNGGSRSSLPKRLRLACHEAAEASKFSDVYGRMAWNKVGPTLTTGCTDITRGRFGHPRDDRAITPREAALLQSFPESYKFSGTTSDIQTQIGNAVPMKLIDAFAPTLRKAVKAGKR